MGLQFGPMGQRDDFSAPTKRSLAARAGHRCSNPTCRRATSRPDPADSARSIETGVAAHITAASPGGPRYDESLTPEARSGIGNGVWLCQTCGKVVDSAPDAFTTDGLFAWKAQADLSAARDATADSKTLADLLADLDDAHRDLVAFGERWQAGEPDHDFDRFQESAKASMAYSNARLAAYQGDVAPLITSLIVRAGVLLGDQHPPIIEAKHEAMTGPTNYIGMRMLADALQRLRAFLHLR